MPALEYITIGHARAVASHLSKLTEKDYSEIEAANATEKPELMKSAIGPGMADLEPDKVVVKDNNGDNKITKTEFVATLNEELTKEGGAQLTDKQIDYLWSTTVNVIKDPGGSDTATNSPATIPSSQTVTNPSATNKTSKPVEDTEAPTLSSSSPSNAATDIAKNSNIDITFSENIRLADSAKVKLLKRSDNTEVGITTSIENGKTLRIKPKADLGASVEYYVKIESGAITDTSKNKNAYAGITANTDLSFTTGTTVLTPEQQAAAKKDKPIPTPGVTQLSSNSLNKPVTKLNLDADAEQSNDEKNLEKLVNLRYGLDLLESKEDVHVALGGNEENYVDGALESLRHSTAPNSQIDNGRSDEYKDGETPTSPEGFVFKQAIEEYKKIDKTKTAETAEKARDKNISSEMSPDEKTALIKVFENYQKKFTKLEGEVSEEKLKKYLTDNYDTLKELGIDDFPADTAGINGKKKEELITLSVAARNNLNEKISEEFKNITISPDDKKAFLKKYTDIDFSNSEKSIELIKGLTDKELLLFNRWGSNDFHSRDFIIRELSQHKLSLDNYFALSTSNLSDDADLMSFTDRDNLLKKYDPKNTDLTKNKEFIQELTPAELVLLNSSSGFVSKQSLLRELEKPNNTGKPLDEIFGTGVLSGYLDTLRSKSPAEIEKIINADPAIKEALIKSATKIESQAYTKDKTQGQLYRLGGSYLVDFGAGKAKFYKSQQELLGLPAEIDRNQYQFFWLANERRDIIGYDITSQSIYSTSLLRLSQNAGRLKTLGVADGSNQTNTLHTILEKIYASEEKASKNKEETTKWHQEMKRRVAKLLMSSSDDEFVKNRQEFQKYLNDTYSGINGWDIFHIDGWRKEFNSADAQTEGMLKEVRDLLANARDSKKTPASP
jgi:hypothetical protein